MRLCAQADASTTTGVALLPSPRGCLLLAAMLRIGECLGQTRRSTAHTRVAASNNENKLCIRITASCMFLCAVISRSQKLWRLGPRYAVRPIVFR